MFPLVETVVENDVVDLAGLGGLDHLMLLPDILPGGIIIILLIDGDFLEGVHLLGAPFVILRGGECDSDRKLSLHGLDRDVLGLAGNSPCQTAAHAGVIARLAESVDSDIESVTLPSLHIGIFQFDFFARFGRGDGLEHRRVIPSLGGSDLDLLNGREVDGHRGIVFGVVGGSGRGDERDVEKPLPYVPLSLEVCGGRRPWGDPFGKLGGGRRHHASRQHSAQKQW